MKYKSIIGIIIVTLLITMQFSVFAASKWLFTYNESADDAYLSVSYKTNHIIATGYTMGQYVHVDIWNINGEKIIEKTILTDSGAIGIASIENNGYIYTVGAINDINDNSDVLLAKIDINTGKTVFIKTFGGSGTDEPRNIGVINNSIIVIGNTNSTDGTFACTPEGSGFVSLLDTQGNIKWTTCIQKSDSTELNDLFIKDNFVYIVGTVFENYLSDIFVMKIDKNGKIVWEKTVGGADYDYGYGIVGDDKNIYIAGTTFSDNIPGFHGTAGVSSDGIVAAMDYSGNVLWQKAVGGNADDELFDIAKTFLGPVAVGYTRSKEITGYTGDEDFYIISLTEYGKIRYEKAWGGVQVKEEMWSISNSPFDISFIAGWMYTGSQLFGYIAGIDEDGEIIDTNFPYENSVTLRVWQRNYLKGNTISSMDQSIFPFIDPRYSRSLVPIRFVAEGMGYDVEWDNKNRIVTIKGNGKTIKLYMKDALNNKTSFTVRKPTGEQISMTVYEGSQIATVNGENVTLNAKPLIYQNRTFVPVRFISETMGSTVKWIPPDGIRIIP